MKYILICFVAIFLLNSCGQKGDLFLATPDGSHKKIKKETQHNPVDKITTE